jgi:hypothetical protein
MNQAVLRRSGTALAGVVLLATAVTACGGGEGGADGKKAAGAKASPEPSDAIKASYLKTVRARFARVDSAGSAADGKKTREVGVKGWYPPSQQLTLTVGGKDKQILQVGDDIYSPSDEKAVGGKWTRIDLSGDGKPGVFLNQDPAEYLAMLLDQEKLRYVGAEKPGRAGSPAEHYRGTFTLSELLRADSRSKVMADDRREALRAALRKARIKTHTIDIWIGADGYPVRVEGVLTDDEGTARTEATFSDFGKAPAIKAPPADQVVDFDDVLQGIDEKLKEADEILKGVGGGDGKAS